MLTDDSVDEPVMPGDVPATQAEIIEAVRLASIDVDLRRRLAYAAVVILLRAKQLKRTCAPEDLLQDAVEAILSGRRTWPKNRIDFRLFVVGVMRSLAWSQDQSLEKTSPDVTMEHELRPNGEDGPPDLESMAASVQTPESTLLDKEESAAEEAKIVLVRSQFGPDELPGVILDKIREGLTHAEVRKALGVADKDYWNARRVLARAIEKLNSSTKEK